MTSSKFIKCILTISFMKVFRKNIFRHNKLNGKNKKVFYHSKLVLPTLTLGYYVEMPPLNVMMNNMIARILMGRSHATKQNVENETKTC